MVSDHSFVNQLTVGRVHARRAIEVENTDRTVVGVYSIYQAKVPKEALLFRDEKRKKDVGTQLTHIRQPRTSTSSSSVRWLDILAFTYYLRSQCITNIQRMQ